MAYLAGSILLAYMASVAIYKIWYIVTIVMLLITPFVLNPRFDEFGAFLADAKWFILYCLAVVISALFSIDPERSQEALFSDAIYPAVFALFYGVGLRSGYDSIERMMRWLVWAALVVLILTYDIVIQDRVGYRLVFVLPYIAPFISAAIVRGRKLAVLDLALLIGMILLTNSRAAFAVAVLLAGAGLYAASPSLLRFVKISLGTGSVCAAILALLTLSDTLFQTMITTLVRSTGENIGGVAPVTDDHARDHLSSLFWQMAPHNGWSGIGYFAFGPIYVEHWHDTYAEMSLHSIYQVWWLEMGYVGTAAALLMLVFYFLRTSHYPDDPTVRACMLGMVGTLVAGAVHQMHQAPMFYVMLGMGLGAARRLSRPQLSRQIVPVEFNPSEPLTEPVTVDRG